MSGAPVDPNMIAFIQVKVACNQVMEGTSVDSVEHLSGLLKTLPVSALKPLHGHLLFVLMQVLQKKDIGSNCKLKAMECMEHVLSTTDELPDKSLRNGLLLCFMSVMYDPESDHLVTEIPEELHLSCIKCVYLLLGKLKSQDKIDFYSPKQAPVLGVLVCICLKQASVQQYRALKVAAIECLMRCAQVLESSHISDTVLRSRTANVFMNFTPGIAAGLQQVICADEKQSHAVTLVALRAWGRILAQVLDDECIPQDQDPPTTGNHPVASLSCAVTSADIEKLMKDTKITPEWLCHADTKLAGNVRQVCEVHLHSHPKVRLEMAITAQLLLTRCSRSAPKSFPPLLEVLLTLCEDECEEVSNTATSALDQVSEKCSQEQGNILTQVLEESFYNLTTSLPLSWNHQASRKQKSQMAMLLGHLRLLGDKLDEILLMSSHCDALLQALVQAVALDPSSVVVLADSSIRDLQLTAGATSRPWCQFHHLTDTGVVNQILLVCQTLGKLCDLAILTSQLLAMFNGKPTLRPEIALILNFIHGTSYSGKEDIQFKAIKSILNTYLEPQVWQAPLSLDDHTVENVDNILTLATVRRNVVQTCIVTEGVAQLTSVTGELARRLLSQVMYPVLERAGSSLEFVSQAGRLGLNILASCMGYNCPEELIRSEAEYFTHSLALGLRRPKDNPGALFVLRGVLAHSSKQVLPCIEPIISDALVRSCDEYHEHNLTAYLKVFLTFLQSVHSWLDEKQESAMEIESNKSVNLTDKSLLVCELLLHHKWKMTCGKEEDEMEKFEEEEMKIEEETNEMPTKLVPNYVMMTEAVMNRCTHVLPSSNKDHQLIALAALEIGLNILACHEDQLLPMVHRVWTPLIHRFSPGQNVVVLRLSFSLLCTMAHLAKNFIRKRTLDKVLPSVCNFLIKQAEETCKQRVLDMMSQGYKLQKIVLAKLGQLCCDLQLQEEEINFVMISISPYLSSEQPPALQESCLHLFRDIAKLHPESVWLHLHSVWSPQTQFSYPNCPNINILVSGEHSQRYRKNVQLLLSQM